VRIEEPADRPELAAGTPAAVETISPLTADERLAIQHNAALVGDFLEAFVKLPDADSRLQDLDSGFAAWLLADDKLGYSTEAVVEIVGAAFGEYCATTLEVRWVKILDDDGEAVALQGIERDVRGFPFHTIAQRILRAEHGFFLPIYLLLKHSLTTSGAV